MFGGTNRRLDAAQIEDAVGLVGPGDWLMLQNEINDLDLVLRLAGQRGCQVAFNVAPVDGREAGYDLAGVGLLIVNEIEAAALAGIDAVGGEWSSTVAALRARAPRADIVLTLGVDGLVYSQGGELRTLPAHAVTAVDETAAGDAFIGYLMGSLIRGDSLERALRMGSAAGRVGGHPGGSCELAPGLGGGAVPRAARRGVTGQSGKLEAGRAFQIGDGLILGDHLDGDHAHCPGRL